MELVNKQRNFSIPEVTPGKYDHSRSVILCNILHMITAWVWCYAPCCIWSQYACAVMQHVAHDHKLWVVLKEVTSLFSTHHTVNISKLLHISTLWGVLKRDTTSFRTTHYVWSCATCCIWSHYKCDLTQMLHTITLWLRSYATCCIRSQCEWDLMQHVAYDHHVSYL